MNINASIKNLPEKYRPFIKLNSSLLDKTEVVYLQYSSMISVIIHSIIEFVSLTGIVLYISFFSSNQNHISKILKMFQNTEPTSIIVNIIMTFFIITPFVISIISSIYFAMQLRTDIISIYTKNKKIPYFGLFIFDNSLIIHEFYKKLSIIPIINIKSIKAQKTTQGESHRKTNKLEITFTDEQNFENIYLYYGAEDDLLPYASKLKKMIKRQL